MTRATVMGASSGYVSISIVPLAVSRTMIGPAPGDVCCAPATVVSATTVKTNTTAESVLYICLLPSALLCGFCPYKLPDLRHADLWTDVRQHALGAQRIHRAAHVLPPGHQIQVDDGPPPPGGGAIERVLRLLGRARLHPTHTIRDPVDVGVDADVFPAGVREDEDEIRGLAPHARERQELVHRGGHAPGEARHDLPARLVHVDGLVAVEADGIDQFLDPRNGKLRHRLTRL